jgi:glycosyltransferase involved in cell wall biosynthesis
MSRGRLAIALVHYTAPPVVGGVERVLARHAVLMADAGHDVRVVVGRGEPPDPRCSLVEIPLMDASHPTIERIQLDLAAGTVLPGFDDAVASLRTALADALEGVDVAIAHNVCSLGLNLALTAALHDLAARGTPRRLIIWHHDLAWTSSSYRSTLHDGPPWNLLREAWPRAVQVVVSEARRRELAALTGLRSESIAVVPNGLDVASFLRVQPRSSELLASLDLTGLEPLLLMPARITPRKNIELALQVVAAIRAAGSPAGLIVTGPVDPHRPAERDLLGLLLALRGTLGLDGAVRFLAAEPEGVPSDAVVGDLYRLADALFLPSLDEGFGLPILEAAVHRLPIICADLPTLREHAGDAATYVSTDDEPAEIAARVLERLAPDRVLGLARRIRREYSWETIYRSKIAPLLAAV